MARIGGRIRTIAVTEDAKAAERQAVEEARVEGIEKRRSYYEGTQYVDENERTFEAIDYRPDEHARLPEHKRLHAYSTQVAECIDFLSDRLGAGFRIESDDAQVARVLTEMIEATDTIAAQNEAGETEVVTDDLIRDAAQAGDVAVYVGWDPIEGRVYLDFWEAESVEFVQETTRRLEQVNRREVVWRDVDGPGGLEQRQVTERVEYKMQVNDAGVMECLREVYWDDDEAPRESEWLGVGRIPWRLLRIDSKKLRTFRGEPLITQQAMETADRYNAVEQIAFLIARYNSHANVAVIGDGASLKLESDGRMQKDVADVLTFPGGTALQVITLPTDPQMIDHQRSVLADAMYAVFGLTRVDMDTVQGIGGISGYALEILNQKADATFRRIGRRWRKDWVSLVDLVLDVHAWKQNGPIGVLDTTSLEFAEFDGDVMDLEIAEGQIPMQAWWLVDPAAVYPNRKIKITLGSGYIVDEVMIRDDFTANLISRAEALRQRGKSPEEITKIQGEIETEMPEQPEVGSFGRGGRTTVPGAGSGNGTRAGSTVGSTQRR